MWVPEMKETAPESDRAESITAALASRLDPAAVAERTRSAARSIDRPHAEKCDVWMLESRRELRAPPRPRPVPGP